MGMKTPLLVAALAVLAFCPAAWAHRPIEDDGSHVSPESAIVVDDPFLSQVVYHEVNAGAEQIWLTFDAKSGDQVYLQLGVPLLDRLEEYHPVMVLTGPGLPIIAAPVDLPDDAGAIVLDSAALDPETFYEPFTGTSSWIYSGEEYAIPETGKFYVAVAAESGDGGKVWLAIGRREEFGLQDLLTYPATLADVRAFHEVDDERLPALPRVLLTVSLVVRAFVSLLPI